MFTKLFINGSDHVQICHFTHIFSKHTVAKSITLSHLAHIISTGSPQKYIYTLRAVDTNGLNNFFNTLSTGTITTIFKIIERNKKDKTNNSLTFNLQTIYN